MAAALARELNQRLAGSRLRAHLFLREPRELSLFFRDCTLHWHLGPGAGGLTLSPEVDPPEAAKPLQAMVAAVESLPDERYITMSLRKVRGKQRHFRVVVELMTNQWNALLLEGDQGTIRQVLWPRPTEGRPLTTGQPYSPPAPSQREGAHEPLTLQRWRHLRAESDEGEHDRALLGRVAFVSPLNLPTLLCRHLPEATDEERLSEGHRLWTLLARGGQGEPSLLETDRGAQPYPVRLPTYPSRRASSFLEAVEAAIGAESPAAGHARALLDQLDRALEGEKAKIRSLEREMGDAAGADELRQTANLILTRLREIPKGTSSVVLEGFGGAPVEVGLDPSLSAKENADALYQEAARQERARTRIPDLLQSARTKLGELEILREGVQEGSVSPEEAEPKIPKAPRAKQRPAGPEIRLPYMRFRSSGGLEIRVGRGAKDNDELTFRHSRPDDVWLHARDASGAHVVLRWRGDGSPPGRDLAEAAILAVLNSRHRTSAAAPVDWTRRKHVRKPRGAPPGTVVPQRVRTLFVTVDPTLPERLKWEV